MYDKNIIETSKTLKEALVRMNITPTFHQRTKLKRALETSNWKLNSRIDFNAPIGITGIWSTLTGVEFSKIIKESVCWTQVMRALNLCDRGSSVKTAHKYVKMLNIDTTHFKGKSVQGKITHRLLNDVIFVKNSSAHPSTARKRILDESLIEYSCSGCGQEEIHNGKPLTLQLEHKNGNPQDHRLENLTFLCPNCHTQTITWGRKIR